jgi:DNA helicase-4
MCVLGQNSDVGDDETIPLLDALITCWSGWEHSGYYINQLAPSIVRQETSLRLFPAELRAVLQLQQNLTVTQWNNLPELLQDRMNQLQAEKDKREQEARDRPQRLRDQKARYEGEIQKAQHQESERLKLAEGVRSRLKSVLSTHFLDVDRAHEEDEYGELLTANDVQSLKRDFVVEWAKQELDLTLDPEQATAVATFGGDVLVTARAGSGKTRVLVTRAIFLMKHCNVPSTELLLLAFNRKAANEMRSRIAAALPDSVPHVMTFHALAYGLVHPEEEMIYDNLELKALARSRVVQDVIDNHIVDREFGPLIRTVMLEHFRNDWETIVAGGFDLSIAEYIKHRKSMPRETLNGEYVKSFGEQLIANALFENGIVYQYERNFSWAGRSYRPDFTITTGQDQGVVIEYFGMTGDPDYDGQIQEKRAYWQSRPEWTLIELTPSDVLPPSNVGEVLLPALRDFGIHAETLTEEEIWTLIKDRAVDKFSEAMASFVSRCRKRNLDGRDLNEVRSTHKTVSPSEAHFLDVAVSVYSSYLEHLKDNGQEDFDGLMWRAVDLLRSGRTYFARDKGREVGDLRQIRHVLVDEFQDFSPVFHEVTTGLRDCSPNVSFFCVGDDWQAINGFAGSEIRFFKDFEHQFRDTRTVEMKTNYRSPTSVVEVSNSLMASRGTPACPNSANDGVVLACDLSDFVPFAFEQNRHNGDIITPAILRLVRRCLDRGDDVVLLARRNRVPGFIRYDQSLNKMPDGLERFLANLLLYLPIEDHHRVTISTTHSFKGLERQSVIIVDALAGSYPLIHPTWIFLRIFGDSLEKLLDDERRLLYVALTRASRALLIVTEGKSESPFLKDIREEIQLLRLDWETVPPVPSLDSASVEIRVFNGYEKRDLLKQQGYRWNPHGRFWHRAVPAETFDEVTIRSQPWFEGQVRVDVVNEAGIQVLQLWP